MADGKKIPINIRTTADTGGSEKAAKSMADLRKNVEMLTKEVDAAALDTKEYEDALQRLAAEQAQLAAAEKKHYEQLTRVRKEHGATATSTKNSGAATLEFSRALEDAQYGINGVLNNLPGLVQNLGGGAGLAGVISIAAVGITFLVRQLGNLGETAEEKAKRLDMITSTFANINRAIDEYVSKAVDKRFADEEAAARKVEAANDAISDSIERKITALDDELRRQHELRKATRERMEAEIELRRLTDPNFSEEDAARSRAKLQEEELTDTREAAERKRASMLETAQKNYEQEDKKIQERLNAPARIKAQIAEAEAEFNKVSQYTRSEAEKDPNALPEARERLKKSRSFFSDVGRFFGAVGGAVTPGVTGEEINEPNTKERAKAAAEVKRLQMLANSTEAVIQAEEQAKLIDELRAKLAEAERDAPVALVESKNLQEKAVAEQNKIRSDTGITQAVLDRQAEQLAARQRADILRAQQADAAAAEAKRRQEEALEKQRLTDTLGQKETGLDAMAEANRARIMGSEQAQSGPRAKELQKIAQKIGEADTTDEIAKIAEQFVGMSGATVEALRKMLSEQEKQAREIENLKARLKKL
jgi:hypothetical protein